ncbi:protease HtpX [Neisseriaceae bacterium ESL0693]|nr:protease HtpX [Neisseriaceae bacterium ESL0693]
MKRIFLFIATNLAILVVINIILNIAAYVFGINIYANGRLQSLLFLSLVVGFTGSFISLFLSKSIAIHSVGAQVIHEPHNEAEAWLLNTVAEQARQWNLAMPQVAIYDSPDPNAFATGATRNNALIAVSTGLLHHLSQNEVEAVLGHEMAHVGNGDMVTMTLLQGVINTFVFFWARLIAEALSRNQNGEVAHGTYFLISTVLQIVFGFLASFIVMWFSRQREYRADACSARLVGASKMIAALQRLKGQANDLPGNVAALGIASSNGDPLLSSHPTLDNRIERLRQM